MDKENIKPKRRKNDVRKHQAKAKEKLQLQGEVTARFHAIRYNNGQTYRGPTQSMAKCSIDKGGGRGLETEVDHMITYRTCL